MHGTALAHGGATGLPSKTGSLFVTTTLRTGSLFVTTIFLRTDSPSLTRHFMMIVTLASGPGGAGAGFGFAIERNSSLDRHFFPTEHNA
jgi:hypothetical protein